MFPIIQYFIYVILNHEAFFSEHEFLKSYARFVFMLCSIPLLYALFARIPTKTLCNIATLFLDAITILFLTSFILILFFNITTPFFDHSFSYGTQGALRFRGIFREPSHLAIFIATFTFFLLHSGHFSIFSLRSITYGITLLFTYSLSGLALLIIAFLLHFVFLVRHERLSVLLRSILFSSSFVISIFIALAASSLVPSTTEHFSHRLSNLQSGADLSSLARVIYSWYLPFIGTSYNPLLGSGLGQLSQLGNASGFPETSYFLFPRIPSILLPELLASETWNFFAYLLGSCGLIGFTVALLLLIRTFERNIFLMIFLAALSFATGGFLEPSFSVIYAYAMRLARTKKN